ncbi:hypothetical protein N9P64_00760 [bacterium]|nr:hypothetical protein [bacterium]MDA9360929.1 hypothetical protein [Flavobacteriaceae bacterium]
MNKLKIKILKSSEVDSKTENEVMDCFNETFNQKKSKLYFDWKFRANPFGESIHVLAYLDNLMVSSRVFWRLDLNETEAYQCVDTSVLNDYHGKGIFRKSTESALEYLGQKTIYNYPNKNSFPAYLKLGWKENPLSNIKFNLFHIVARNTPIIDWPLNKLRWRFKDNPEVTYYTCNYRDQYLILRKKKSFYFSIGKINFDLGLKKVKPILLFSYEIGIEGLKIPYKSVRTLSKNYNGGNSIPFYHYDMI